MHDKLRRFLSSVGAVLVALCWAMPATATDGTFHSGASTFANTDHNTVTFKVNPALENGGQTALSLNFGSDGASSTPAAEFVTAATVKLSYAGTAQFNVSYGASFSGPGTGVAADINLIKIGGSVGKYVLTINYNTPAGAGGLTGDWTLEFTNVTPNSARVQVAVSNGGNLTGLATAAACGTGSTACPSGQSCKGPCFCPLNYCQRFPWRCVFQQKWVPKWEPWPGPGPCRSCPNPWQEKFGDDIERRLLTFVALKDGVELGQEKASEIQLKIEGGKPVGELVDLGGSEYAQLIEMRKGAAAPRVSAMVAGAAASEFIAGPAEEKTSSLTTVLALLLALALAGLAYFASRGRGPQANAG